MSTSRWRTKHGFTALRFFDADHAAEATPGAAVEISQKRHAACSWRIEEAALGESRMLDVKWPEAIVANGLIEDDTIALAFGANESAQFTINGELMHRDSIAYMPEGTELVVSTARACRSLALQMSKVAFEEEFYLHTGREEPASRVSGTFRPGSKRHDGLSRAVLSAIRFSAKHAQRLPEARVSSRLNRVVLGELMKCLHEPANEGPPRRRGLIRKAAEYLHEHRDEPIEKWDLCRALGVSDRGLRRLFAEAYGMSPVRYLRLRRLQQARRRLRDGPAQSVTDVGIALGFYDLGRFAADYRALFGELPSITLQKRIGAAENT